MGEGQVPWSKAPSLKSISERKAVKLGMFKNMGYYREDTSKVRNMIEVFENIQASGQRDLQKERLVEFRGNEATYSSPGRGYGGNKSYACMQEALQSLDL